MSDLDEESRYNQVISLLQQFPSPPRKTQILISNSSKIRNEGHVDSGSIDETSTSNHLTDTISNVSQSLTSVFNGYFRKANQGSSK